MITGGPGYICVFGDLCKNLVQFIKPRVPPVTLFVLFSCFKAVNDIPQQQKVAKSKFTIYLQPACKYY